MLALLRSERDLTYVFVAHHLTVVEPPCREAAFIAFAAERLLSRMANTCHHDGYFCRSAGQLESVPLGARRTFGPQRKGVCGVVVAEQGGVSHDDTSETVPRDYFCLHDRTSVLRTRTGRELSRL